MFKKVYFLFMFFVVLSFSCSKENENEDEIKPVTHKKSGTSDWIQVTAKFYDDQGLLLNTGIEDFTISQNGNLYCIGSDWKIYRKDYYFTSWREMSSGARGEWGIAVEGEKPWHINKDNHIYKWTGSNWQLMPGKALHIAITPAVEYIPPYPHNIDWNTVGYHIYMAGTDEKIYYWNGSTWIEKSSGARGRKVAVDGKGNPWHINRDCNIYRWTGSKWVQTPGKAREIAAHWNGAVYIIGTDGKIYFWSGSSWIEKSPGTIAEKIALDTYCNPWYSNVYLFKWYTSN